MTNLTPEQQAQVEKVRKGVAEFLCNNYNGIYWEDYLDEAVQILSLPDILIKDADQSLPWGAKVSNPNCEYWYRRALKDILDANFVKVIKVEE